MKVNDFILTVCMLKGGEATPKELGVVVAVNDGGYAATTFQYSRTAVGNIRLSKNTIKEKKYLYAPEEGEVLVDIDTAEVLDPTAAHPFLSAQEFRRLLDKHKAILWADQCYEKIKDKKLSEVRAYPSYDLSKEILMVVEGDKVSSLDDFFSVDTVTIKGVNITPYPECKQTVVFRTDTFSHVRIGTASPKTIKEYLCFLYMDVYAS